MNKFMVGLIMVGITLIVILGGLLYMVFLSSGFWTAFVAGFAIVWITIMAWLLDQ